MDKIAITGCELDVLLLTPSQFYEFTGALSERPAFCDAYSINEFIDEKRGAEKEIRDALSRHWRENVDFEVGADGNIAFTLCGGIYSSRIVCFEYLNLLHKVLQTTRMRDRWAYATAIELRGGADRVLIGEFVLQGRVLSINSNLGGIDFLAWFSRSRDEAATGVLIQ
jgi:hypothetical protein